MKQATRFSGVLRRLFAGALALSVALLGLALPTAAEGLKAELVGSSKEMKLSGAPDANIFRRGVYQFQVHLENGTPSLWWQKLDSGKPIEMMPHKAEFFAETLVFGGLALTKPTEGAGWSADDKFTIDIIDPSISDTPDIPRATLLNPPSGNVVRNRNLDLQIEVVDFRTRAEDASSPTVAAYSSSESFPLRSGSKASVEVGPSATGLATFIVTLPVRYSGKGNSIAFTISYRVGGETVQVSGHCSVPGTKEYVEEEKEEDDEKKTDPLTPYVIVESYSYGGASVQAGTEFELKMVLRNTSDTHTLQNIVMHVAPQGIFSVASASNTIFIDQLYAGSTVEKSVFINAGLTKVTDDKDANTINIKFNYQFLFEKERKSGESSEIVTLPVDFPDRFEISPPEMSNMILVGEEAYLYVPMVNKGRSSVYNLTASVRGSMSNPGQTQYIGNLTAGQESGAEFNVLFEEPGTWNGEVVVTYEDANMNPREAVMPFSMTVQAMDVGDPGGMDPGLPTEPEPDVPVSLTPEELSRRHTMLAVGLAVGLMTFYLTVRQAKAKRSIFSDEEI